MADPDTLNDARTVDGLSGPLRDWLYEAHFPSLAFANLVHGQVFRRYAPNVSLMESIEQARGFLVYPTDLPTDKMGPEAILPHFFTTKLQAAYFERTLEALQDDGVPVAFLLMPVKTATRAAMTGDVEAAYLDYLRSMSRRFPDVRLINDHLPGWPSDMFSDATHLNLAGAERFTDQLADCIESRSIRSDCNLDWDGRVTQVQRGP